MRILLAIHNAYTDSTSGAAHSMRILMEWLAEGGHECRVLGTGRFDARPPDSIDTHLAELAVPLRRSPPAKSFVRSVRKPANVVVGRPTVDFTLNDVPVTMLLTKAQTGSVAERIEGEQFLFLFDDLLRQFTPDVLVTYGGHSVVQESMRRARERGVLCVFSLRNRGYEDVSLYRYVDHVFTTSPYLTEVYRQKIGLKSTGIESPIEWAEVEAPDDMRKFVTFVNPSLHKGAMLFARLADMLGQSRPDIPLLIVQSATGASGLNAIAGLDFKKYPQIMVAPATTQPSTYFALTKILLVPSAFNEPFGRVAAEALINGIPPLVSDRGALPETIRGAGRVLPLPAWLDETSQVLPSIAEAQPWFDAVCELWDDRDAYDRASQRAREAARWYGEDVMRQRYLAYFASLRKGGQLFESAGSSPESR
jgi:glycosyltransferase involved in cell wall biosynthesis